MNIYIYILIYWILYSRSAVSRTYRSWSGPDACSILPGGGLFIVNPKECVLFVLVSAACALKGERNQKEIKETPRNMSFSHSFSCSSKPLGVSLCQDVSSLALSWSWGCVAALQSGTRFQIIRCLEKSFQLLHGCASWPKVGSWRCSGWTASKNESKWEVIACASPELCWRLRYLASHTWHETWRLEAPGNLGLGENVCPASQSGFACQECETGYSRMLCPGRCG